MKATLHFDVECILNIAMVFAATAKLIVRPGAVFKAKSDLTVE